VIAWWWLPIAASVAFGLGLWHSRRLVLWWYLHKSREEPPDLGEEDLWE